MADPKPTKKKTGKRKRAEAVYVPVAYPFWLGVGSFAWAVVGWLIAAYAPRLAFVPAAGALHLVFPTVTIALLGANLYFAIRNLLRGAHALRLALVTGIEIALFTTLFFQLYAHVGAELYDAPGETTPWQWLQFSAAHAFRAGDVLDAVEAYGWGFQAVKHTSPVVAVFVIVYHVVVDVFFLGLVWAAVGRFREALLADDEFRGMLVRLGLAAFAVWFVFWAVYVSFVRPWRFADVPLWYLENAVRVVDFADVMESFGVRFHTLPREGVVGTLTILCRLWIGIGLAVLLTRKQKPPQRRVLTPPGVAAGPYWGLRAGALAGMAVGLLVAGLVGWLTAGRPAEALAAAVTEGPEGRSQSALRALRRMGPSAETAVPGLVAARPAAPPAVRDDITRTLGYLGATATTALRTIALTEPPETAALAVDSLAAVGGPAAPDLVAIWEGAAAEPVKDRAGANLRGLGGNAVAPLIDGFTAENADGHFQWLQKLDPNWRLRATDNPVARACQGLPDLLRRARNDSDPNDAAAAMGEMRACGSAAKANLDTAFNYLGHKDTTLQSASAGVVRSVGPGITPRVLEVVRDTREKASLSGGVVAVLSDPAMWDAAVMADPQTLPTLLGLAARPEGIPLALRHLGHYGPAAAPVAPLLIPKVADPDDATRAAVRAALDRVHPKWKADPALTAALPTLLYQLPHLPKDEADELYAALGAVSDAGQSAVTGAVNKKLREVNEPYRGPGSWDKTAPERYAKSLDEVFAPVERLGPKGKALVPALNAMIRENTKELNDPKPRLVTARLLRTLPLIGGDAEESIPGTVSALGYGQAGFDFLRSKGKAGLPFIGELIAGRNTDHRALGVKAAAALGPDAAPVVPQLLAALKDSNRMERVPDRDDDVWFLGEVARALTAIDPDWWGRPEAAAAFGPMVQLPFTDGRNRAERRRVLDLISRGGPGAVTAAPKLAAATLEAGLIDEEARGVFDKLDAKWREAPEVREQAPGLAKRISGDRSIQAQKCLLDLGPVGAEGLTTLLRELPDEALKQQPGGGRDAFLRDRGLTLLTEFDPPAKAATPTLLALAAKPELHAEAVPNVFKALDKTDPGWAADPTHKAAVKAAGDALAKRAGESATIAALAARCGVEVGAELTRQLAATRSFPEREAVLEVIGAAGPAAKSVTPALLKLATDHGAGPPQAAAVAALGKVGAGDATLVAPLAPLLLAPDAKVRAAAAAVPALDRVDRLWRENAATKQVTATAVKQLASPEAGKRVAAADAIGVLARTNGAAVYQSLIPLVLDTEPAVREAAGKSLDGLAGAWRTLPAAKTVAATAVKQLASPDARKRFDAVGALELLRPADAVPALELLVGRETDANTKQYAEQVLGRLRKTP